MKASTSATDSLVDSTVGDLCDRFGGDIQTGPFGSQLHSSDYSDEGVPVVMPQDLRAGRILLGKIARVHEDHARRLAQHRLALGDVVFSRRGDVGRFAIVSDSEVGWLCGTGCIRVRFNCPDLDTEFLRHALARPEVAQWLAHHAKGVTMPNLNTKIIRALPITLPPLAEQKRIAAILDAAEALREKRSLSIKIADSLTRATFFEMFGDADDVRERLLIEVCSPKQWPTIREDQLTDEGYPVYGANGRIGFYSQYNHEHPTVLITCRGATCGTINVCESRSYVTGNAMALDNPNGVSTAYLEWALRVRGLRDTITGSAQPQITRAGLANVRIPVPPIERQLEFTSRLEEIRARTKDLEQALELTRTLQASLQRQLFVEVDA